MMKTKFYSRLLCGLLLTISCAVMAQESPWLVRGRLIDLQTQQKNDGGAVPEDSLKLSNQILPEVDGTYFFTKNIAAELVLVFPQSHDVTMNGSSIGTVRELPPTLTLQYHFMPDTQYKPYVGAGITYLRTFNVDVQGYSVTQNNFGPVLQAGIDYKLTKNWYLNADIKKAFVNVSVFDGDTRLTTMHVDPLLFGLGVGYRF